MDSTAEFDRSNSVTKMLFESQHYIQTLLFIQYIDINLTLKFKICILKNDFTLLFCFDQASKIILEPFLLHVQCKTP